MSFSPSYTRVLEVPDEEPIRILEVHDLGAVAGSVSGATIEDTTNLIAGDGAGNGVDSGIDPTKVVQVISPLPARPTTLNEAINLLVAYGLCSLVMLGLFLTPVRAADFGDIPANLALPANQSVRRNAGNTAFEAYTPGLG